MPGFAMHGVIVVERWIDFYSSAMLPKWLDRQKRPIHQETTSPLPGFICTRIFTPISFLDCQKIILKYRGFAQTENNFWKYGRLLRYKKLKIVKRTNTDQNALRKKSCRRSFKFFNLESFMTKVLDMAADDTNYTTSEFRPKSDNLETNILTFD